MREVFVDKDHARVGLYKSLLDQAGIPSFIRNQHTGDSLLIGIPALTPSSFSPALCVINDEDYEEAMKILEEPSAAPQPSWHCVACKEEVPGTFDSCWQCGTVRPGSSTGDEFARN